MITSFAPPAACLKKTNASAPLPPVIVTEPGAEPAIKVSLPDPAIMVTDDDETVVFTESHTAPVEFAAFNVSLPEPETRYSGLDAEPPLPLRFIVDPDAPKIVTVAVPLFTVEVLEAAALKTTPPAPDVTELVPVPPRMVVVPVPPTNVRPVEPVALTVSFKPVTEIVSVPFDTIVSPLPLALITFVPVPPEIVPLVPAAVIVLLPVPPANWIAPAPV